MIIYLIDIASVFVTKQNSYKMWRIVLIRNGLSTSKLKVQTHRQTSPLITTTLLIIHFTVLLSHYFKLIIHSSIKTLSLVTLLLVTRERVRLERVETCDRPARHLSTAWCSMIRYNPGLLVEIREYLQLI